MNEKAMEIILDAADRHSAEYISLTLKNGDKIRIYTEETEIKEGIIISSCEYDEGLIFISINEIATARI